MNSVYTSVYAPSTPECFQCAREEAVELGHEPVSCFLGKGSFLSVYHFLRKLLTQHLPFVRNVDALRTRLKHMYLYQFYIRKKQWVGT